MGAYLLDTGFSLILAALVSAKIKGKKALLIALVHFTTERLDRLVHGRNELDDSFSDYESWMSIIFDESSSVR